MLGRAPPPGKKKKKKKGGGGKKRGGEKKNLFLIPRPNHYGSTAWFTGG